MRSPLRRSTTQCTSGDIWVTHARSDQRDSRNLGTGAPRPASLGTISYAGGGGAGYYLDLGRTRSHPRWIDRGRPRSEPPPALHCVGHWARVKPLSRGRGRGSARLWMDDRPAWPQTFVFYHLGPLPRCYGRDGFRLEFGELLFVPDVDGRRDRRRIQRGELDDSRNDPGPLSWLDRPCHQWIVLDRRRAWRGRLDRRA